MITFLFSMANAAETLHAQTPTQIMKFMDVFGRLLPFILIAVILYLFIIRPQNKQRQMLQQMINNLKPEDRIITKGGIIGTITRVNDNSFIIELHDGTKMEILKNAVISIINDKQ
jgi:preprotein translocase subunit YajC